MSRTPHDEFPVNGTLFRFPPLPPEEGRARDLMLERRATVLGKARKVRGGRPPRYQVGTRVTLLDATMAAPAGTRITVAGHDAEVWCAGPVSRSVWALRSDGRFILAQASSAHGGWYESRVMGVSQRAAVVLGWVAAFKSGGGVWDRPMTDDERHALYGRWDRNVDQAVLRRVNAHQEADYAHFLWYVWHRLYPHVPFDFSLVPDRRG